MEIRCRLCGQDMEIEGDLTDGQMVLCPHCGGKSEFHKPMRIELPTELSNRRAMSRVSTNANVSPAVTPETGVSTTGEKKNLKVIRNVKSPVDAPNQEFSRRLHMSEEHARFYEEMKDRDGRRKMREKMQGVLMLIMLVLCGVGVYWYVGNRKEKTYSTNVAALAGENRLETGRTGGERSESKGKAATERRLDEERHREELRRQDAERQRVEREERQRQEERMRAEREERQKEQERLRTEQARKEKEQFESRALFRKACSCFEGGEFAFFHDLSSNSIPGSAEGEFFYLYDGSVVVCQSATNGIRSVFRLDDWGKRMELDAGTFLGSLQGKDYLMAHENRVYFKSKRERTHMVQIPKTEVVDLRKKFFGDVMPEVERRRVNTNGLRFEIVFIPKDSQKIIVSDTVESDASRTLSSDESYSLPRVRESIEDAFPMRATKNTMSSQKKSFKRTVVFWDGDYIKKGADGVTYVPRQDPSSRSAMRDDLSARVPRRTSTMHEYWSSLYAKALDEDRAERQFNFKRGERKPITEKKPLSKAEQFYAAKIDRIYNEGTLWLRAQIEKPGKVVNRNPSVDPSLEAPKLSEELSALKNDELEEKLLEETCAELEKSLADKRQEYVELKKKNPGCVLKTNLKNIRNLEYRMPGRADKRYYNCRQVTHVRDVFWCTRCKRDYSSDHDCPAARASGPIWEEARRKVEETTAINAQIDALLLEIEELERELTATKAKTKK